MGQRHRARLIAVRAAAGAAGQMRNLCAAAAAGGAATAAAAVISGPVAVAAVRGLRVAAVRRGRGRIAAVAAAGQVGRCAAEADAGRKLVAGCQAAHLQRLGRLDEAGEAWLRDAGFALVHKVEDALHLPAEDVLEHDDRVFAGVVDENFLEVGGAGGEDDLVGSHAAVLAHDGAVNQPLILNKKE